MDIASFAELLHETAEHHDAYERSHAPHHWWDWYAAYIDARQDGKTQNEASEAADRYMDQAFHVGAV
ncbi:MAG TPA: bleomycin resistance protein [Solirubrobacteraceae bacterium]|nr:bleomycin resistance protein [Solirubrobacteraceae bacterium]